MIDTGGLSGDVEEGVKMPDDVIEAMIQKAKSNGANMGDPDKTMAKMRQKLVDARKHADCMPPNCLVGDPDECPHREKKTTKDPTTGKNVSNEPDHPIPCPECGGALDTIEIMKGRGVTSDGIWVTEQGDMHVEHSGHTEDFGEVKTIGAMCSECSWAIERPDWFVYMKDYEANEVKRIREEFIALKEGRSRVFITNFHEGSRQGIQGPYTETEAKQEIDDMRSRGINPDAVWDGDECMNGHGDGWRLERTS